METKTSSSVIAIVDNGIGIVTLNRPDTLNAINHELAAAWASAIDRVVRDTGVRAILLRAEGKAFSVGGDLAFFSANLGPGLAPLLGDVIGLLNASVQQLRNSNKPVVSAVQGALGGGGIGLALSADVVICDAGLKMRSGYAAIGLSPDAGASCFLAERIGGARARALFMTNRTLSADDCSALGIVDRIVPTESLQDEALDMARQLADKSETSMEVIKSLCNTLRGDALAARLSAERDGMMRCAASMDATEGISAFVAKRKPLFRKSA
ncbi:enoyl-CoA hydratase FadB [Cupriavidus basilensis OR16]|uniref:Enoyl-CoA hydratase FadB n=1 Tax=Cupriavidus basilensis OR16 TaxID=1127483 RepID=H1S7H5_9BURK|nr:enoyl-CoA hydratase/isomerase family protein [Cupriavidus basilensis]EHP41569.1 enoyl-CoA hydratase FadB [Cupriavidus basilensis OR16]